LGSHPGSNPFELSDSLVNKRYYLTTRLLSHPEKELRKADRRVNGNLFAAICVWFGLVLVKTNRARCPWATREKEKRLKSQRKKGYFFIRLLAISPPTPNNVPINIMLGSGTAGGADDQTTAASGYTYTYDDEGNRLTRTETSTGHVESYEWDHRNRLTSVKDRNTSGGAIVKQVDYEYDAQNRLVKRTYDPDGAGPTAATTQYWTYDDGINAVLQFDGASSSNLSHRYLWSNQVDDMLEDEQVTSLSSGGNTLWGLADHLGTLRDIADLNESTAVTSVTNHRKYTAFGGLVSETNTAVDLIYGYTGKQLDDATNLQHNLFRWYDSLLGQWLSEDPLGFVAGDENVRRMVQGALVSQIDPLGLQPPEYPSNGTINKYADYQDYINQQNSENIARARQNALAALRQFDAYRDLMQRLGRNPPPRPVGNINPTSLGFNGSPEYDREVRRRRPGSGIEIHPVFPIRIYNQNQPDLNNYYPFGHNHHYNLPFHFNNHNETLGDQIGIGLNITW
jgi:RHS repeat-associated protein